MNLTGFFNLLALAVRLYNYEDADNSLQPVNTPQTDVLNEYDFIIVGAGTAGCVLANRLTEIENWQVLLIEAGDDEDEITDTPAIYSRLVHSRYDWNYSTVEQKYLCRDLDGRCIFPRGHVMGGSSSINGMFYIRGNMRDYDEWEEEGNPGWSFQNVKKYFRRLEKVNIPVLNANETPDDYALRGHFGPCGVQFSRFHYLTSQAILDAAIQNGYIRGDYNGVNQERIGFTQSSLNGPTRQSASKAYLNPIRDRTNLHIIKSCFVKRILFDGASRAVGVEYLRDGQIYEVAASREVILSAGAVNTPQLLMLSGVGPSNLLQSFGIPVVQDLPVGKNLQDHAVIRFRVNTNIPAQVTLDNFFSVQTIQEYAAYGQGPLTVPGSELLTFKRYLNASIPNGQWFLVGRPSPNNRTEVIEFGVSTIKPRSRGSVTISSPDPFQHPLIDPRYFDDDYDRTVVKEILNDLFRLLRTPILTRFNFTIDPALNRLCSHYLANDDQLIDCFIANQSQTYYHPVGTARMGPSSDGNAVVDSNLNVYGVENLRVLDASVMPAITRGNTNAPTCMIAEKGSDIIKQKYGYN